MPGKSNELITDANNFDNIVEMTFNLGILLRGNLDDLKKITEFLEQQDYARVVFSQFSADKLWIKKGSKGGDNNDK